MSAQSRRGYFGLSDVESAVVRIVSELREERRYIRRSGGDIRDQECIQVVVDRIAFL